MKTYLFVGSLHPCPNPVKILLLISKTEIGQTLDILRSLKVSQSTFSKFKIFLF